jgi:hypothetical protein
MRAFNSTGAACPEGSVSISGTGQKQTVNGCGYMEPTGYFSGLSGLYSDDAVCPVAYKLTYEFQFVIFGSLISGGRLHMRRIRRSGWFVSILMTFILLAINLPAQSVFAVMVGTEAVLANNQDMKNVRESVRAFLDRNEIQSLLSAGGIDPGEAKKRVDSLSDTEVRQIADKIEQLPAGRSFSGTLLYLAIIAVLVLLITEMLGYTDII